jgi:hypothetical protein
VTLTLTLIDEYKQAEGIQLDRVSIAKNSGQRTLAKLKLNSMWGKWTQNQNKTQTMLTGTEKESYDFMMSPEIQVSNLLFPNEEVIWVS